MKRAVAVLFGLALVVSFAGTANYLYHKTEKKPVVWGTVTPKRATIIKKTVATGSVVPRKEVAIKPQVSGIIAEIYVEAGKIVASGDLVARIQIIPDMVTLNSAESRVNRARIQIDDARREQARLTQLHTEKAVSDSALQVADVAYDNAKEELQSAVDNLELIRKGTTRKSGATSTTLVRATIAGMVLEVPVEAGDSVIEANTFNEGTTITTIADMNELIFEGKVDESEVGKIRAGMDLVLTVGAIEDQKFDAVLEHIAPKGVAQDGAIQFQIRAALKPHDNTFIRANLSANADIVLDRRDDVLAIDEAALQFDDGKPFVEVEVAPQVFAKRPIEVGLSDGLQVEILSGVAAEDKLKNAAKAAVPAT